MGKKKFIRDLSDCKRDGQPVVMMTAWDYPTGRIADEAGVDVVLVGDSLGNVALGYENTIAVRLDDMVHHTAAVRRGVQDALLVADMPFMTYKVTGEDALRAATRLVQDGGAEAVKLEGGREIYDTVKRIVDTGIPVMGHVGLTPQSIHALSGYHVQGREMEDADRLRADVMALQDAGCFSVVLECLPVDLAQTLTGLLGIPTIGIGAGPDCDGQVLVLGDLVGLTFGRSPRFVRRYADLGGAMREAVEAFSRDVRAGTYPDEEHSYPAS